MLSSLAPSAARPICAAAFALLLPLLSAAEPVRLILDTDIGNDIDDALAMAMIHALQNRGEVELLAVTISKDNRFAAPYVNLVNTFYGRPDIPIGVVHNGKTPEDSAYLRVPSEMRNRQGAFVFPHAITDGGTATEAVALLTRVLQRQPDHSVTMVQIGFSTNLARLLQAPGGRALVEQKVKLLSVMGGNFLLPVPEYNIYTDPQAAAVLFQDWPTPVVYSGFEIGSAITFPYRTFASGFTYGNANPVAAAARSYFPAPEDRAAWDPTAVLYAVRPDGGYFDLSEPGRLRLGEKNTTVFEINRTGNSRYLLLRPERVAEIRQLLVDLVTEPPLRQTRK